MLDEPTNHLDIATIEWLENLLIETNVTLFFITHDRSFLDRVCTRIVELDRGRQDAAAGADELVRFQQAHQDTLLAGLRVDPRFELLEVSFPELVADPVPVIERLVDFLGRSRVTTPQSMADVVRPDLFRNRHRGPV